MADRCGQLAMSGDIGWRLSNIGTDIGQGPNRYRAISVGDCATVADRCGQLAISGDIGWRLSNIGTDIG